ncbi:MAG: phosphoenolpyruvate carboxykinase (ATP) [Spirochaetes bacterium]|nr:phosphoenolpyruvate carboxykinase (ATP) [Spirochaetota bacterium]
MSSSSSYEFYKDDIKKMSPVRAIAETLLQSNKIRKVTAAEAYSYALKQSGVIETDLPVYTGTVKRLGLPKGAKVLVDDHGKVLGRTASARRFYNRLSEKDKGKVLGDLREAVFKMQRRELVKAEACIGLDPDMMIKATFITTIDDMNNVFNWLANFTPFEEVEKVYSKSKKLPCQDIIIIADNNWENNDPFYQNIGQPQLALVDEVSNVIFNFGMRYFGERKKGTLTLAWASGRRLGMAACHGGIKEIDFSGCKDAKDLGKRSIAFFGLSGTGKSSHTNSEDNGGTMPQGFKKVVLHDDAFQIDPVDRVCRVWEPSLFDKTDSRPVGHPDWNYFISCMNHAVINVDGKRVPLGQDVRNANGRALIDRDLLGEWVNRCNFPHIMAWLMKDTILPPIVKFTKIDIAVAMGTALMTKRNKAENVKEEDLGKLVFEPFANPFRVYELYKDVEAFTSVFESGAQGYSLNSAGFWSESDEKTEPISLQTSLTLQTAILTDRLEWEDMGLIDGVQIPTKESVEKILPGYYDKYNPKTVENRDAYISLFMDRFQQRIDFLKSSDVNTKPELLDKLVKSLTVNI